MYVCMYVLKTACAGDPNADGLAALRRIERGVHPSREPKYCKDVVLGRPTPIDVEMEALPKACGSDQSVSIRVFDKVQSLLDRVKSRAQNLVNST